MPWTEPPGGVAALASGTRASSTRTSRPAFARVIAAVRPFGPEPITSARRVTVRTLSCRPVTAPPALSERVPRMFLSAEWRWLVMLNFGLRPKPLAPLVPADTELDDWNGITYASVVGFMFLRTRVFGVPVPGYRDFEELNLRFYVRRRTPEGWRRGVVFVKEVVPRRVIAAIARYAYNEHYVAHRMRHEIGGGRVEYALVGGRPLGTARRRGRGRPAADRGRLRGGVHHRALLRVRPSARQWVGRVRRRASALARVAGARGDARRGSRDA